MHGASEIQLLVARGGRTSLLLVRERSRRILSHRDFRDGAAGIKAKARLRLLVSQDH